MKFKILIVGLIMVLVACEKSKDDKTVKEYPKEVFFNYNGQDVTYSVIKKDYLLDADGIAMTEPITKLWLDRNLGAERMAVEKNDALAAGDLYQWGRLSDGHQNRNSDTTQLLSGTITPNHNLFIASPLSSNWLSVSNDLLWGDEQNTNCSCPEGWRVPTKEELAMEMQSWSTQNMDGAYSSSLKWVSGGSRDNHGTERYSDFWAFVWSSSHLDNGQANMLAIIGDDTAEIITSPRIYGGSVRCIMDY